MDAKSQKLLKAYVKTKVFVAVEPTVAGKTAVEKMLKKTAVARKNVHFAKNASKAIELIKDLKPHYVFCHEKLEDGTFEEVLAEHEKNHINRLESGFFLFTENDSIDSVSKKAQLNIDSIVLLPFTVTSLQSEFLKVIVPKSDPSEYEITVESAREHTKFDMNKAFDLIKKAKKLEKKPLEALYLEGTMHFKEKSLDQARECFEKAVKISSSHYPSLKDLFQIHMIQKEKFKAYKVSSKMNEVFPVAPEMIPDLAWVSVACAEYDDILNYYTAFKNVEDPDGDLKNYIAASLTIYGKKIIQDKHEEEKEVDPELLKRAYSLMEDASIICADKPLIFASLINALQIAKNQKLVESVLTRAKNKFPKNKNIKVLEIMVNDSILKPAESLKQAQDAINSGLDSPELHEIVLKRSIEMTLPERSIDDSLDKAIKTYPKLKDIFENLVNDLKSDEG